VVDGTSAADGTARVQVWYDSDGTPFSWDLPKPIEELEVRNKFT